MGARPVRHDEGVMWGLAGVLCVVILVLYRRMLASVSAFVPARTHWTGWRTLDVANDSDTWVFIAFAVSFPVLLALDWPLAFFWLMVVIAGMEVLRRRHNNEPATA